MVTEFLPATEEILVPLKYQIYRTVGLIQATPTEFVKTPLLWETLTQLYPSE